jgi:twitching motility protein PilT
MATEIESLLEYVVNVGGSELIVTEGAPSAVRLAGKVCAVPDAPAVEFGALREFLGAMEGDDGSMLCGPWAGVKWRVRYFREALGNAAVFRPLIAECPPFNSLGAPGAVMELLGLSSGLVVFAGPACSGKTTTASSYVKALCESKVMRVSLLDADNEIPITVGNSLVLKDSVGSVDARMSQALRSGCDLIWLGDFKGDTLLPMLRAAEAGAIVVCCVTAGNSAGVLDSLLSSVPAHERDLCRTMLAAYLKSVVVQRLLPGVAEGSGAVPAWEVMFNTQNASTLIRSGEFFKLPSIIAASVSEGMLLMDDCLVELVKSGFVAREEAERYVSSTVRFG